MVNEKSTKKPTDYPISFVASPQIQVCGRVYSWKDENGNVHFSDKNNPEHEEVATLFPAYVWMYIPIAGEPESQDPAGQSKYFPPRVYKSSETPAERLLKTFDRVTLLELIMPYLDALADELRPLIEGLREETRQLKSKCKEIDANILSWKDRAKKLQKESDKFESKYREAVRSLGKASTKSTDIRLSAEYRTMQAKYQMDIDSLQLHNDQMAQEMKRLKS
ncbi:hypothetical protein MFRU_017g00960 [Monilinia fructicola]|uniref:DUF4124 domain-containing protein n=1 Tax=Monilinia fructicola TaxID=38448 RepID=A0A5M9JHZ6_MONFR|nr:hypothetical protein EYC84_007898 [Monilinia fructicola]KAG4029160.1 hypothetical protein MFRU_017g00960 [Monilinia fructicola]